MKGQLALRLRFTVARCNRCWEQQTRPIVMPVDDLHKVHAHREALTGPQVSKVGGKKTIAR